ncbi:MAG: hypothetical protein CMJ83_02430 [Planctomycetes bacterium]|nr:hypothetical protein [Planctomycetota bacterium]
MPATVITKEPFKRSISKASMKKEVAIRIQAGAIRSWLEDQTTQWMLSSEWNVIGGNDSPTPSSKKKTKKKKTKKKTKKTG